MKITKDKFEDYIKNEWLLTNGIGGFSSSTICNCNTRKYHGLLVAALGKFGERFLCLSKLNESVIVRNTEYSLSTNECHNYIEKGYEHQRSFEKQYLPFWEYEVKSIKIEKEIAMKYGENKIAIKYKIKTGKDEAVLKLQPLVNFRNFHETKNCFELLQDVKETSVNVHLNSHGNNLHMIISEGTYEEYKRIYYRNMYYRVEENRGLDAYESHYMPGEFNIIIPKDSEKIIEFIASVDESDRYLNKANASDIIRGEKIRIEKICKVANAKDDIQKELVIAADNFIIEKNNNKTIIAGYPWFGDWGRDTFIALEGLTLKTNRFKDAKEIIYSFKNFIKDGLVPNLISEDGGSSYNSVDASLWYIDAIYKYYKYTMDKDFAKEMYPSIIEIINAYKNGTLYDIKMDSDGLIKAGNSKTQLTWMDAKVGDTIPTPRFGKAVEINALWYNSLKIAEILSNIIGEEFDDTLSLKVEKSFEKFYTEEGLLDTLEPNSAQIRPNQVIAIGIEFSPINKEKAREILRLIEKKLYTNKGLKTLYSDDEEYRPYYFGGVYERDLSYHQGTVWPFLLMFYNNALIKYDKKINKNIDITEMLSEACIGNVSEIYDAEEPRLPKGAFAQAWSIAMLINNEF